MRAAAHHCVCVKQWIAVRRLGYKKTSILVNIKWNADGEDYNVNEEKINNTTVPAVTPHKQINALHSIHTAA